MFALACKSERQCRALEMAEMMPTSQGLQMLIDYASKTRHSTLADKVANIARNRTVDVDDDDYDRQPNRSLSRTDRYA
jgi:chromosome transmission fidelity protein 4